MRLRRLRSAFVFLLVWTWLTLPTEGQILIPPQRACIEIVGDSLVYGSSVMELIGTNFVEVRISPFVQVFDQMLHERGIYHVGLYDLSAPAVDLDSQDPIPSYYETNQFTQALKLQCPFVLIFPWLNDLPPDQNPAHYEAWQSNLNFLMQTIRQANPQAHFILVGLHSMQATSAGQQTYGSRVDAVNIDLMRTYYRSWCNPQSKGQLLTLGAVTCHLPFSGIVDMSPYLLLEQNRVHFQAERYRSLHASQMPLIELWLNTPTLILRGDGVHYNEVGMYTVAQGLAQSIHQVNPQFFSPLSN